MFDAALSEKFLLKRLRRRAIRHRSQVLLDRKDGGYKHPSNLRIGVNHSIPARLIELSTQGAAVFTKAPLYMGESLALTMSLGGGDPLREVGEVIARKKVAKHGGYLAKLKFLRPNPKHVETVDRFLLDIESEVAKEMRLL